MNKRHLLIAKLTRAFAASGRSGCSQTTAFTYQGRRLDGGAPANGIYDVRFHPRDALTSGNPVGATNTLAPVPASNGLFPVTFDFGNGISNGSPRWLEIAVRTNRSTGSGTTSPDAALHGINPRGLNLTGLHFDQQGGGNSAQMRLSVANHPDWGMATGDGPVLHSLSGLRKSHPNDLYTFEDTAPAPDCDMLPTCSPTFNRSGRLRM